MITLKDIIKARKEIHEYIHKTPLFYSRSFSELTNTQVYLKAENLQKTGSFKVRGAFNKIIHLDSKKVTAASMGNHAQAVAFAASTLGLKSKIIMPQNAPIVKEEATKGYGADVLLHGENFSQALAYAKTIKDHTFIHTFDDDKIISGQGTIGLEIAEDLKDIDYVFVPVGGGGLISGISLAIKSISPKTKIIGVQSKQAPSASISFKAKKITERKCSPTLADGIAIGKVGKMNQKIIREYVDEFILVDDQSIAMAIYLFLERKKLVVEGAGATPLAALINKKNRFKNKKIVLVLSGGNIDFMLMDRIIHSGLVKAGRIEFVDMILHDDPGNLNLLTKIIAENKANILNIEHERFTKDLPLGMTRVSCTMEIRNLRQLSLIKKKLQSQGIKIQKKIYS